MTVRPNVDAGRLVNVLIFLAIAMLVGSLVSMGSLFALFALGAAVGGALGWVVFAVRHPRGLGASPTSERPPDFAGTINATHIPVIGIGGLGLLAMSIVVAMILPRGQTLMMWSLTGAVVGAAAFLMWRHFFHDGSPFVEHPDETLHLR